jgi:aryl-alcohol dehydrogenase-like predicted oxidoreductase
MQNRPFGKTGWRIGLVGLGCWQFGGAITLDGKPDGWTGVNDADSIATIKRALDLGVNFFDTADMYGWGHSEEILGQTLKSIGCRDRVHLATKVGFWHDADGRRTINESRDYILRACDASLRRLQTSYIDLYQCHLWRTTRWEEILDAFETLQRQGKIRHFGLSSNDLDVAENFNIHRNLAVVQANYNLLDRRAEKELIPYCRARGIAFVARSPLARGLLSGKYDKQSRFDPNDIRSNWLTPASCAEFERNVEIVRRLKSIAQRHGFHLAQLAIKFVLNHVGVSVALVGSKTPAQLEDSATATFLAPITREEQAEIEAALILPEDAVASP